MALVTDQLRKQLHARFAEELDGPVEIELFIKPGSGRLILPSGVGCATCPDARDLAEAVAEAGAEHISLRVVDVTTAAETDVQAVPTMRLGRPGEKARISYQGLPAGLEFATVVDAVERLSRGAPELSQETIGRLERATEPIEVMIFTTPT